MHRILLTLLFVPLLGCGAGEPCEYNGEMLSDGDSLHSEDGCNYCTCNDGVVTCIEVECLEEEEEDTAWWYND